MAASPPFFRRWYSRIAAFPSRGRCPAGAQFTAAVSRAHALTVLPSISYHSLAVLPYSASSRQSIPAFGRAFSKEKRILRYSPFAAALRSFDSVLIFSDKQFFNIRRFSPLRMTKCAAPPPLNLLSPLNPLNPLLLCYSHSRDSTPRGLTCHQETFGHRPIYICGEAATTTLNPEP